MFCNACPFECSVDRSIRLGRCRATDEIEVAQAQLHYWEEPPISGTRGSGTIFFTHCNLRCKFCQNYDISQEGYGHRITPHHLEEIIFRLQDRGAHNINLVSPTHYTLQLIPILEKVKPKLQIPVVWNSNAYEKVETLHRLEGLIDIYLPDLKYFSDELAQKCSSAPNYFQFATKAILEMKRQVNKNRYDECGIIQKGLIIRHLVLPGQTEDSKKILLWIKENLGPETQISLMAQYYPTYRTGELEGMNRRIRPSEYRAIRQFFIELGFEQGYCQELSAASSEFTPDFEGKGI